MPDTKGRDFLPGSALDLDTETAVNHIHLKATMCEGEGAAICVFVYVCVCVIITSPQKTTNENSVEFRLSKIALILFGHIHTVHSIQNTTKIEKYCIGNTNKHIVILCT